MVWLFLLLGLYPYLIYPILVWAMRFLRPKPLELGDFEPTVTVVITAYNEAEHIEATVRNKLEQNYPAGKLKVLVVSDDSSDGTDLIVQELAAKNQRLKLIRQSPRQGKTSGLNLALLNCDSEIVVFSDANSMYQPDALRALVRNFNDRRVGYVTGKMEYITEDDSVAGHGSIAFMRYENWLRELETAIGSLVGVDGGIDAVRRMLYKPMREDNLPDFVLPLSIVRQGYRVVYEKKAVLTEHALQTSNSEYRMRVRVATRALWALLDNRDLANPLRYGIFSWQIISHKWLRYLSFIPLAIALFMAFATSDITFMNQLARAGFLLFAAASIGAWVVPGIAVRVPPARWCLYFLLLNLASVTACKKVLSGERIAIWKPRQG